MACSVRQDQGTLRISLGGPIRSRPVATGTTLRRLSPFPFLSMLFTSSTRTHTLYSKSELDRIFALFPKHPATMCDDISGSTHDYGSESLVDAVPAKNLNVTASHLESFILTRTKPQDHDLQELAGPNGVTPHVNINETPHFEDAEPRAGQDPSCVSTFDKCLVKAVPGVVRLACKAAHDAQSEAKHIESDWSERLYEANLLL